MADKTPVSISLTSHQKRLLHALATAETNGNKSAWIVMAIEAALPRIDKKKAKGEHSASAAHRNYRTDGKCNPALPRLCPVCYEGGVWWSALNVDTNVWPFIVSILLRWVSHIVGSSLLTLWTRSWWLGKTVWIANGIHTPLRYQRRLNEDLQMQMSFIMDRTRGLVTTTHMR